ncbi:hypothetical protein [Loktanella sp. SALINAS62]|uniref:hypothetical protein n=1 Tax=Loktanella sp. SALINAS62 TaxID=2706124 RepID=UPI001B8CB896|nr:hypothetical protein [Loktanella sp. SALINAS62]
MSPIKYAPHYRPTGSALIERTFNEILLNAHESQAHGCDKSEPWQRSLPRLRRSPLK